MGSILGSLKALAAEVKGSGTAADITAADISAAIDAIKTEYELGGAEPAAHQADSTATDAAGLKTDFNALLAKLIAAGLMKSE